jgi:hypothetical protein
MRVHRSAHALFAVGTLVVADADAGAAEAVPRAPGRRSARGQGVRRRASNPSRSRNSVRDDSASPRRAEAAPVNLPWRGARARLDG